MNGEPLQDGRQDFVRASMLERWSTKVQRIRGRRFLDAAMAAAALVSTADEHVRLSEQFALDRVLQRMEKLRVFDPRTGVELHRRYVERITAESGDGRRDAIDSVSSFRADEEQALLILYVGAVVAKADGDLSEPETRALADISAALGLPLEESLGRIWGADSAGPPGASHEGPPVESSDD
jgi:tellurite resistance protein